MKWVRTLGHPYLNAKGEVEKILGTIQDITEQMMYEQKLLKSRMLLKEAQKLAELGSFEWNVSRDLLTCSDEFFEVLEIPDNEIVYNLDSYLDKIHNTDRAMVKKRILKAQKDCTSYDIEHRLAVKEGIKVVKSQGSFRPDNTGKAEKLFGFVQDITKRKKAEMALIEGQEMERKRIAREIHDGIGQMLVATKFNIAALEGTSQKEIDQRLDELQAILEQTIEEARRITQNLSTRVLEELGLEKAVQQLCKEAAKTKPLEFDLEVKSREEINEPMVAVAGYRIIQESINNIVKYANASLVNITLENSKNEVKIKITDNGDGFDINSSNQLAGNGLSNMTERAKSLNGDLTISSAPGKGTKIEARIPID